MKLIRKGILFCLCGPAGVGKTLLGRKLLDANPRTLERSISLTSRAKREGEVQGESYHFVSKEEFQEKIDKQELFEWEEVHGQYYGTLQNSIDRAIEGGTDLLLIVDVRGSFSIKQRYPKNAIVVFVVPPSFKTLKERLIGRGRIDAEELARRVATARSEYETLLQHAGDPDKIDYLVLNDDLELAFANLSQILGAERSRLVRIERASVEKICHLGD